MRPKSLLDIVQSILNDMNSDEVNSITDTIESQQVAVIVRDSYYELIDSRMWPHLQRLIKLNASTDPSLPTHVTIPERLKELSSVRYDTRKQVTDRVQYRDVRYRAPDEFLQHTNARVSTADNVDTVVDPSYGVVLLIRNDAPPTYYTSFDDKTLVFDSYDSVAGSTLLTSRFQVFGYIDPLWEMRDNFVPDLPPEAFSNLLEEAKSTAFVALKQMPNEKAEQKASRQSRWLARKAWRVHGGIEYQDFGRKSARYSTKYFKE